MVTKLNRKSLRAQQEKGIKKSHGVFALPVTVLHANTSSRARAERRP